MTKQKSMYKNNDSDANIVKDITVICGSISPEIFVMETSKDLPWNPVISIGVNVVGAFLTKNSIYLDQSLQGILFNKLLEM